MASGYLGVAALEWRYFVEKVLPVLDSTESTPLPLALEPNPDASLVQKDPESLQSHWDLFIEIFKVCQHFWAF